VVVLADRSNYYGMVVDRFMGERELVVQVMPAILGKVQDISAAALMEDGSPVLIVDVDDLVRSIEKILKVARINKVHQDDGEQSDLKRVLVVDDSITVREVERKMIEAAGYHVDTAVDGMDGLNMLRSFPYDLLVTDVDMPRMNGIELVKTVRQDPSLRGLPVMMVSYKDREEDRMRGLEAGADYYLTKGSLHDETLRQTVVDLIGEGRR
jgi:two-component system sensor histidine kinase and response regulator WspE